MDQLLLRGLVAHGIKKNKKIKRLKDMIAFKFLMASESKWDVTKWDSKIISVASFSRTFWVVHSLGF